MDAAAWGWIVFALFLVPWLAVDAWLWWTGRRTYSQAAYQLDRRSGRLLSVAAAILFVFLWWHFFG